MHIINDISTSIKRTVWVAALLSGCPVKVPDYVDLSEKNTSMDFGWGSKDSWWSYYSGSPMADLSLVDEIIDNEFEIDWEKTGELVEDVANEFTNTFNPSREIPILKGILRTKSGAQYPWVSDFKTDFQNLINLLTTIKEYESKTDEEVIKELKNKFSKIKQERYMDSTMFGLTCIRANR